MKDSEILIIVKQWLNDNIENQIDITIKDNERLLSYIERLQKKE